LDSTAGHFGQAHLIDIFSHPILIAEQRDQMPKYKLSVQ
jgi:hypothetical protein